MKKILFLLALSFQVAFLGAQTKNVRGSVADSSTSDPVIGASVFVKGTTAGTVTGTDGSFSLSGVPADAVLTVSCIGYLSQDITVPASGPVSVFLDVDTTLLDEVVVVGYGTRRKSDITDAITTVDTQVLESRPVVSLGQSLQGTVPGLNLSVGGYGGELGQNLNVNIRGTGTISTGSSAATLILIDGIEGNMNNLNPDDVESISVLKDAAASSIYGSRAAFGVILITTKKGQAGKPSVSYSGNVRYAGPNRLPAPMDSWEFANFFNEGSINSGASPIFNEETLDRIQKFIAGEITTTTVPNTNGNWQFHEKANDNVNWYTTHYKWAFSHEHNLNINGGDKKTQYYVSANFLDQNGNLRYGEDKYNRFSTNAKLNTSPFSWLDMEFNVKYVHYDLDNPFYTDLGGLFYHDVVRMWPTMPFKDPNGYYMRNGKLNQLTNGSRSLTGNDNVYLQGKLTFHPLKNWNIYLDAGYRIIDMDKRQNLNQVYEHDVEGTPLLLAYGGSYASGQTGAMQQWTKNRHLTANAYTDYIISAGNHQVKLMAGANAESYNNRYLSVTRMDLISETVPEVGAATGEDVIKAATAYSWATAGFFGRVNYDYGNKYFLAGNVRYDGSSRFLAKDRWGTFGSVSAGWNIAKEPFFPIPEKIMNQFKPRISWGSLGNQNTDSIYPMYLTQTVNMNGGGWLMNSVKPNTAGAPGTVSSSLTWETVRSLNAGLDLGMFSNRLTVNFDWFVRKTLNMVGPASEIASIYGVGMPASNNTDLKTSGFEVAVNYTDRVGKLNYHIGLNLSDAMTTVTRYPNESKSLGTYYEGQKLGEIWGYVTEGIAKSDEQMTTWLENNRPEWGSGWGEGDIMYTDLDGNGIINTGSNTVSDPGDRKIIGNSTPRYAFGLNLGLDWNGFDFSMFWQGILKRDLWVDGPTFFGLSGGEWQSTGYKQHLDYYRPADTDSVFGPNTEAYYPKIYMSKEMNQRVQTRYLQSGAYARLKNVQLGYSLPQSLLSKAGIGRLRVYVIAENLLTITSLPDGFDPETVYSNYTGSNTGKTYPLQTTVALGVNVTF